MPVGLAGNLLLSLLSHPLALMKSLVRRYVRLIIALLLLGVAQAQIRVLLVEGASNHGWENRIGILESILSKAGGFELTVELAPANTNDPTWATWSPDFSSHDVVISGYRGGVDGVPEWPSAAKAAFESYVSNGGGFVAFHEATQAWPRKFFSVKVADDFF